MTLLFALLCCEPERVQESVSPNGLEVPTWVEENLLLLFLKEKNHNGCHESNNTTPPKASFAADVWVIASPGATAGPKKLWWHPWKSLGCYCEFSETGNKTMLPSVLGIFFNSSIYIVHIMKRECFAFPRNCCICPLKTQWGKCDENWDIMLQGNQLKSQSL